MRTAALNYFCQQYTSGTLALDIDGQTCGAVTPSRMLADDEEAVTYPDGRPAINIYIMSDRFSTEQGTYKKVNAGFAAKKAEFLTGLTTAEPLFEGAEISMVMSNYNVTKYSKRTRAIVDGNTVRVYATTDGPSVVYISYNEKEDEEIEDVEEKTDAEKAAEEEAKKEAEKLAEKKAAEDAAAKRLLRYLVEGDEEPVIPDDGSIEGTDSDKKFADVFSSVVLRKARTSGKGSSFKDAEAIAKIDDLEGNTDYEFFVVASSPWPKTYAAYDGRYTAVERILLTTGKGSTMGALTNLLGLAVLIAMIRRFF